MRTVAVAVCRTFLRQPARGRLTDEPPLLLCNGISAASRRSSRLVDALDPDRGVVRFNVPGVGSSKAPPFPYPIAAPVRPGSLP